MKCGHAFPWCLALFVSAVHGFSRNIPISVNNKRQCKNTGQIRTAQPRISMRMTATSVNQVVTNGTVVSAANDAMFGQEFTSIKGSIRDSTYWKGKRIAVIPPSATRRSKELAKFNNARVSFILDSVFMSSIGLCITWYFGTFIDSFSYFIGAVLGLGYANLLSKFVENLGTNQKSVGGNARFLPVILLILVYAKNKETVHIIPELLGFFSYQAGSLLQIFNSNLYGDEDDDEA